MASFLLSPFLPGLHRPKVKFNFLPQIQIRQNSNPNFKFSASSSSTSDWEREEVRWIREDQRWLREDQRWLREEQRWVREEQRWRAERESLLKEIEILSLKIQSLERGKALDVVGNDVGERFVIAEKAEIKEVFFEEQKEVEKLVFEEVLNEKKVEKKERRVLRMGAEGEDVKELQEALLKLGFYSGDEEMEFSSFSSGTERAVKTWQSSLGKLEDGIMTLELLERLLEGSFKEDPIKDIGNGAPSAAVSKIKEIEETIVKESSDDKYEESSHRVFLLGENRWEEPSRLKGRDKIIGGSKITSTAKCLACRGEGQIMCLECDGSGEPNIETQFMEWIDDGAKCAYCEGLGYTVCDVCEGNGEVTRI